MNEKNGQVRLALIPLLSAVGSAAAIYLSKHYYDLRAGTGGFGSICNISSTLNCDAVTSSKFAELYRGLPLASFVAGWFFALLIIGLLARVKDWRREAILTGTIMSGFASLYSIGLLIVMSFVLHKFCLFCLVIDAVNFTLFGLFFTLLNRPWFSGARSGKLQSHGLLIAACVFVMVVILRPAGENERHEPTSDEIETLVSEILATPTVKVNAPATAPTLGSEAAPVTIYEFSDFQCPHCKLGALMMHQLLSRHEGGIRVVFMPFPLDSACNRLIPNPMHPYACELARTAFCGSAEGKFVGVYEKIFEEQDNLNKNSAKDIALANGMTETGWKSCVNADATKKALDQSIEEGIAQKVEGTPTYFVNGKKVANPIPMEAWELLLTRISKQ
ncbi:MAG: thioredoxin domain-containing protein [Cryobacterium sp.]|nr:thioredoxin domain-containing protein [Oligoflexia bacterium]